MNGPDVMAFARMVARWFVGRGAPQSHEDDMASVAALAVMETYQRYQMPLGPGSRAYHWRAAVAAVAEDNKRSTGPFRMGGRAARRGQVEYPEVVSVDLVSVGGGLGPEEVLAAGAGAQAERRLASRVARHARRLPARARGNVAHLVRELVPGVRAPRRRPGRNAAWGAVRLLARSVAADPAARADRAAMLAA